MCLIFLLFIMMIIEEAEEATADADAKCISAKLTTSALKLLGYGFRNQGMNFKQR